MKKLVASLPLFLSSLLFLSGCMRQPKKYKGSSASPHTINDFSRLNATKIKKIYYPRSYKELSDIVLEAAQQRQTISVIGSRHSQGGQAFYHNNILISLKNLNTISNLDLVSNTVTIQAGATWHEVQKFLNPHNRAVKIMQFANLFTIGGSLSVNCNGIDPHNGPLIESVRSFKIMLADGSIKAVSRTENEKLFSLAIGGYGLFGIILEATFDIVPNDLFKRKTRFFTLPEYKKFLERILKLPSPSFHFAFLNINLSSSFSFSNIISFDFKKVSEKSIAKNRILKLKKLQKEYLTDIKKLGITLWCNSRLIQALHWIPEGIKHGAMVSRNNIMSPPASYLYVESKGCTHLLQEYFIPLEGLESFIKTLEDVTRSLKINLFHVALRFIKEDTESFLPYAKTNCVGIVLFFEQKMNDIGNSLTQTWTQLLIDAAIKEGGTYYLPIQLHATDEQLRKAYPNFDRFIAFKKYFDPKGLFINHLYKKYSH